MKESTAIEVRLGACVQNDCVRLQAIRRQYARINRKSNALTTSSTPSNSNHPNALTTECGDLELREQMDGARPTPKTTGQRKLTMGHLRRGLTLRMERGALPRGLLSPACHATVPGAWDIARGFDEGLYTKNIA